MDSPRLGGRRGASARGTPRMGTPTGGSFAAPAPKGTLVLGKGKARLRASGDGATPLPIDASMTMRMSREASYDMPDAEVLHSRIGSYQPGGKTTGEKGRIFAKSEEMTVSFHESVPLDVIRAMGVDEGWKETYTGGYDTATGYSWTASGRNTWIWKHQRNPPVPPTVHIFASPPARKGVSSPPHVILLPVQANASNEPALLLISPTGTFRFWSSIFLGLAGGDRFLEERLPLAEARGSKEEEIITIAQILIPALALTSQNVSIRNTISPEVIVGTSKGRTFRASAVRKGDAGEWSISIKQMVLKPNKPSGILSGLFGFGTSSLPRFGGSSPTVGNIPTLDTEESDAIVGITMGAVEADGVDAWVLTSSSVAIWRVSDAFVASPTSNSLLGTERLVCKAEALTGIQDKLLEMFGLDDDVDDAGANEGVPPTGALPWQMERRERRLLAMGVELLDIALVKTKLSTVDPREPSNAGSREEDEMETEAGEDEEELMPIILVSYTSPSTRYNDGVGISWRSSGAPATKDAKRPRIRERSYATIACRFEGVEGLSGNRSAPTSGTPSLRFEEPISLPYADGGKPNKGSVVALDRGVSFGFGVGGTPGAKQGCFTPRLAVLQTTVSKEIKKDNAGEGDGIDDVLYKEVSVTVLASIFEGGMVLSTNDGPFRDHLFMRTTHPFPRSVGFGIVGKSLKSGSSFTPYALSAARLSSSSLVRPPSRSQLLPSSYPQYSSNPTTGEIAYLTTMGIVTVTLDFEKIASVDERSGGSNQIRSIMEQAVLYGPVPDNPFAFRFSSNVNSGYLATAASQLSQETLESSPKLIKRQLGLTTHLADRAARLAWLIQFINDNGALNRLNIPLRTMLATHAEKIAAAQGVWAWYDGTQYKGPATAAGVGSRGTDRSQNMLVQVVDLFQEEDTVVSATSSVADGEVTFDTDEEHEGDGGAGWNHVHWQGADADQERNLTRYVDPVRAFFKLKVGHIGELISYSVQVVKTTVASFEKTQRWPDVMVQAGRLALVLLEGASQFRKSHYSTYGLDPERPDGTPWTAESSILDACMYLFEECGRAVGDAVAGNESQKVLQGLATVICEGYKEQLAAISIRASIDWTVVQERFIASRRKVWGLLVQHGAADHAFKLAEDYGDFKALTELCYKASSKQVRLPGGEKVQKVDQPALRKRIDRYLESYKQEFAFELYRWWIDNDMAYEIFKQSGRSAEYVEAFFAAYDHPSLAWLHQIGKKQFATASSTLQVLSQTENRLGPAKFLLSMGKLCELVELTNTQDMREMEEEVHVYDEALDLLDVQQKLRTDLMETIAQIDITRFVSETGSRVEEVLAQSAAITEESTTKLQESGRSESAMLFKRLVANLIGDVRLAIEDTVDILTLKDNIFDASDFAVGVQLIYDCKSLPDERREKLLCTLWRRVYLRDDWSELSDTRSLSDAQITDRLRSTALFATLREMHTGSMSYMLDPDSISKLVRAPAEILDIPTIEDLTERYSQCGYYSEDGYVGYTEEDIATIYSELEKERELLDGYISILDGAGLRDEVARIEEGERPVEGEEGFDIKADGSPQIVRGNSLGLDIEME